MIFIPAPIPINSARGSQASANNVWYEENAYAANKANDGNPSSRWAAYDNPALPNTYTLNFIKEEFFDLVKVNEYKNRDGSSRIADFTVKVLQSDGITWDDVYQGSDISQSIVFDTKQKSTALSIQINALTRTSGPSFFEVSVYQTSSTAPMTLSDDELLESEARLSFEYFWREANTTEDTLGYGLVADTMGSRRSSIACSGFALSALVIAVECQWISYELAQDRCLRSLQALWSNIPQYKGFFYHFIDMDTLYPR